MRKSKVAIIALFIIGLVIASFFSDMSTIRHYRATEKLHAQQALAQRQAALAKVAAQQAARWAAEKKALEISARPPLYHHSVALSRRLAQEGKHWWLLTGRTGKYRYQWYIVLAKQVCVVNQRQGRHYQSLISVGGQRIGQWNGLWDKVKPVGISARRAADNYCDDGRWCEFGEGWARK